MANGNYQVTLSDYNSYDIDHQSQSSKGIVEWMWFVKEKNTLNAKTYSTKTVTFEKEKNKDLEIALKVKDLEGQWSDYYYLSINDISSSAIDVDFTLKAADKNLNINSLPATEVIDICDIKTIYNLPLNLEIYLEDKAKNRTLIFADNTNTKTKNIDWQSVSYKTLKSLSDGLYGIVIKAIDKNNISNFSENQKNFSIVTPIDLKSKVAEELISGTSYTISASSSKYTDYVNLKVLDRDGYMISEQKMNFSNIDKNARKQYTSQVKLDQNVKDGEITFEFTGVIESSPVKKETISKKSKHIGLSFARVNLKGDWSKWDGGKDLKGNKLKYNPRRFLSFERIYVEAFTVGSPNKVELDLSDALKAMKFVDDKGNEYKYKDFVKYEVKFPLEFEKISDNHWKVEYILPLAKNTLSFEDKRLRDPYELIVKASKGSSSIRYTIDKNSKGGGIEITGNIYDHIYIQKKR
jgi:hypothetical protein